MSAGKARLVIAVKIMLINAECGAVIIIAVAIMLISAACGAAIGYVCNGRA